MGSSRTAAELDGASALLMRFELEGHTLYLNLAIEQTRRAMTRTVPDNRLHAIGSANLAVMLLKRHERFRTETDLEEAERNGRVALEAVRDGDEESLFIRANLVGGILKAKYDLTNNLDDLDEGLRVLRDMAEKAIVTDDHPEKATTMNNFASLHLCRYQRLGRKNDLDQAIQTQDWTIQATLPAEYGMILGQRQANLAHMLQQRSLYTWDLDDLHRALAMSTMALDSYASLPEKNPGRALLLSNYGNQYENLYDRTDDPSHLDLAIQATLKALVEIWDDDVRRFAIMDNLANKLNLWGSQTLPGTLSLPCPPHLPWWPDVLGSREAVDLAVTLGRMTVQPSTSDQSQRACRLHNLSNHLAALYENTQDSQFLIEAVAHANHALELTPRTHPIRATRLHALALKQELWYASSKETAALQHACANLLQALKMDHAVPFRRVRAGAELLRLFCRYKDYEPTQATEAAEDLLRLLPAVHTPSLKLKDRRDVMSEFAGVAANACAIFLDLGQAEKALKCLESGRAVMIGGKMEELNGLGRLKQDYRELSSRFVRLRDMLNPSGHDDDRTGVNGISEQFNFTAGERQRTVEEFSACIQEIRQKPGYEKFMTGQSLPEMRACSAGGHIIIVNLTDLRSDAILVSSETVRALNLPLMCAAEARNWLKKDWLGNRNEFGNMNKVYSDFLSWLWNTCVQPIFQHLGFLFSPRDGLAEERMLPTRIWWIGSALATSLPFHAAGIYPSYKQVKRGARWKSALELAVSSYTPSIKALGYSQTRAQNAGGLSHAGRPLDFLVVAMPETPKLKPLNVLHEDMVRAMSQNRASSDLRILKGPDACCTRNVLAQMRASVAPVVHFGCHGVTDRKDPWRSHLVLHRRQQGEAFPSSAALVQDWLTVEDLVRDQSTIDETSRAALAFLSACSTAENRSSELADEVIHLASGFQVAGFAHVVACLWKTYDGVAGSLAGKFYTLLLDQAEGDSGTQLLEGRAVADALRASVLSYIQENTHLISQPLKWVQFVHYGA